MNALKFLAAAWVGACIRNEEDRRKTFAFLNSAGVETEKIIKSFFRGGANYVEPEPELESKQDYS